MFCVIYNTNIFTCIEPASFQAKELRSGQKSSIISQPLSHSELKVARQLLGLLLPITSLLCLAVDKRKEKREEEDVWIVGFNFPLGWRLANGNFNAHFRRKSKRRRQRLSGLAGPSFGSWNSFNSAQLSQSASHVHTRRQFGAKKTNDKHICTLLQLERECARVVLLSLSSASGASHSHSHSLADSLSLCVRVCGVATGGHGTDT